MHHIIIILINLKVFEDHAARRLIKKMDVNCCNEGCDWVGNLSSLLEVINRLNNSSFQTNGTTIKYPTIWNYTLPGIWVMGSMDTLM